MPCLVSCTESQYNKGLQKDLLCFGDIIWLLSVTLLLGISLLQLYRRYQNKIRSKKFLFTLWVTLNVTVLFFGSIFAGAFFYTFQDMIFNMTYTGLLYFFAAKYIKLKGNKFNKKKKLIFYSCFLIYILFLIITFIYELASKENMCSKEKGILVIFGGIIPAGLLIFLGYMQTKEMRSIIDDIVQDNPSVSMDEIVSKESQIDHLWELIVVYAIAKFMSLMVVIYFWVETDQTTENYDCFYIPKDRLKKQPSYFLLEILLSLSIRFITIYIPLIYTIRLFWAKKINKKSKQSNSLISFNDDTNLQYGNFQYGTTKTSRHKNKDSMLMNNNISLTEIGINNTDSSQSSFINSKVKSN